MTFQSSGTAQVLLCTAPIFATLLGCIILGERFGLFEVASILATIVGVTLVMKPAEIFATGHSDKATTLLPVLAALVAAFGWGACGVLSRDLFKGMHLLVVTAWIAVFTFFSTAIFGLMFPSSTFTIPPDLKTALLLTAVGIVGILVMYTFNMSFMVSNISISNLDNQRSAVML